MWFWKKKPVIDEQKIREFLTRGVAAVYPSAEFLEKELKSGRRLSMYLGIDPTGPTLHLGHLIPLRKLQLFQELGHEAILLIGDFTGMIGDPTDKTAARRRLSRREVLENARLYKEQASKFLSFGGENPARLKYNSVWNGKLSFEGVLDLASHVTVDQMLKRDMFENRMKEGKPIYLHEFLYPMIQGYDSVAMGVSGELGGNDQTFNMLVGRTLVKQVQNREKFVMATKLLADSSGKKMGKTEGNMITFLDSPEEMVGKIMSISDELIVPAFELSTGVALSEIRRIEEELKSGGNPRDAKLRLAETIVTELYGGNAAGRAVEAFVQTFSRGEIPAHIPTVSPAAGTPLSEILVPDYVASKSELRRLIDAGAIERMGGERVTRIDEAIEEAAVFRIGKKKFVKVNIQ